jgi:hypothetical protein
MAARLIPIILAAAVVAAGPPPAVGLADSGAAQKNVDGLRADDTPVKVAPLDAFSETVPPPQPAAGATIPPAAAGKLPEPFSWALMIIGVGGAGAMLRRRRVPQKTP